MINQDLLDILRCPMDPQRKTSLIVEAERLVCPRCGLKFPIKDGFPVMVVEEAELPAGCDHVQELAARHEAEAPANPPTNG